MLEVEEQLRRYGEAVERATVGRAAVVRDLSLGDPSPPSRSPRWLAAAAVLLLVAGIAVAATRDDGDRIRTAAGDTEARNPEGSAAPAPGLDCGPDGLISSGSGSIAADASGRVQGAEPTPEAALRRYVEEWTLVRYPAVDEVRDGGDAGRQPGYTLERADGSRANVTYRLSDLRVVGVFGVTRVNEGEGWVVDGVGTCFDWSRTLPAGTP